jgi:hypothetical protein
MRFTQIMTEQLEGSRVGLSNGNIFSVRGASIAAESNSRELLEIVHIVISDEGTSDKVFFVVINKSS